MKSSHLLTLLEEADFSPEQLAERLSISNMTVRRWMNKPPSTEIPRIYSRAIEDAVYELVGGGILTIESATVKEIIEKNEVGPFQAVIRNLGLSKDFLNHAKGTDEERLIVGLSQIGASEVRKAQVDENLKKISKFKSLSDEWSSRIATLLRAIRSKEIVSVDKLVAYGALFYLICPFDLIPDYLPVIGYLDDFAILGLAANYFLRKFQSRDLE